jgi:hypothetical protein
VDAAAGDDGMRAASKTTAHAVMLARARWRMIIRQPFARIIDGEIGSRAMADIESILSDPGPAMR